MRFVFLTIFLFCSTNKVYFHPIKPSPAKYTQESIIEKYASDFYDSLHCSEPAYDIFKKAIMGYLYLKNTNLLDNKKVLTIVDYSKPSKEKRLFVIDLDKKKILFNELVAHAAKTGDEIATSFSNEVNSEKNSLGFYVTGRPYWGKSGYSLKLLGVEKGYNNNAFKRGVVLHRAKDIDRTLDKMDEDKISSKGCIVVNKSTAFKLIDAVKGGSCLFVYFPDQGYLENSIFRKFTSDMLN